jgi:hypothetical protein
MPDNAGKHATQQQSGVILKTPRLQPHVLRHTITKAEKQMPSSISLISSVILYAMGT